MNFRSVAIPGKDGDEVFGTAKSDEVWLNVFWPNRSAGSATIDLRGGVDRANIHLKIPKESFQIEVSIDGKLVSKGFNITYNPHANTFHWLSIEGKKMFLHTYQID